MVESACMSIVLTCGLFLKRKLDEIELRPGNDKLTRAGKLPIIKPLVVGKPEICCTPLLCVEPMEFKPCAEMETVDVVFCPSNMRLPVICWSPLDRLIEFKSEEGVIIKSPIIVLQSPIELRSPALLIITYPPLLPHPPAGVAVGLGTLEKPEHMPPKSWENNG